MKRTNNAETQPRSAATLRQRILAVGCEQSDLDVMRQCGAADFADGEAEAANLVAQGLADKRPFSLIVIKSKATQIADSCPWLGRLWELDAALHAILCIECCDATAHECLARVDPCNRHVLLGWPCDAAELCQIAAVLLSKSLSERQLHNTREELVALNGRRSIEIANAHADLINLNRKLESAKDAAESANRAKSAFLATMSHEIRTPMTAMLGFADYLLDEGDIRQAPRERIEAINTIVRNGRHLVQLINDILDLSKIEANRVELERITCRPVAVVADVLSLMRGRAEEKQLDLQATAEGLVPEAIQSDPTRLRQILVNIVGNAIKFTERGRVRIVMRYVVENNCPLLQFEVADTGIGMTREQIGKLFRPFSQADMSMTRRYGGSGLGLCISQRFAELLGGRIDASSEPGKGTSFCISVATGDIASLRLVSNSSLHNTADEDPYAVAEARRVQLQMTGRILIAEDGPDNQRLFAHLLRKAGAEVTLVDNGELACKELAAAASNGLPYDMVLMDMQMPVLDGYAATGRLRAAGCDLPIVALTAFAMTGDREKCLQAGCTDYLTKPIDRSVFLPTVAKYLAQSRQRRAAVDRGEVV